jgi:hypothetical protein
MKRAIQKAVWGLLALFFVGCDEKLSSITGPTPDLSPSFSSIQREVFNVSDASGRLACVQCHTDQGRAAAGPGLVLLEGRAYQSLIGRPSVGRPGATIVIPGDPDNSYLVKKLEGHADIAGQMVVIRRWIRDGAANN